MHDSNVLEMVAISARAGDHPGILYAASISDAIVVMVFKRLQSEFDRTAIE